MVEYAVPRMRVGVDVVEGGCCDIRRLPLPGPPPFLVVLVRPLHSTLQQKPQTPTRRAGLRSPLRSHPHRPSTRQSSSRYSPSWSHFRPRILPATMLCALLPGRATLDGEIRGQKGKYRHSAGISLILWTQLLPARSSKTASSLPSSKPNTYPRLPLNGRFASAIQGTRIT